MRRRAGKAGNAPPFPFLMVRAKRQRVEPADEDVAAASSDPAGSRRQTLRKKNAVGAGRFELPTP